MGVLGLTPFLQKYCPQTIKELPHRLQSLSGTTIAIDGTLITQRLHFAQIPSANRHVLGWYKLIRELREAGVNAICVFDGHKRSAAKQQETDRRRRMQRMHVAREAMELERLNRLRHLTTLLKQYQSLPDRQKDHSTKVLRNLIRKAQHFSPQSSPNKAFEQPDEPIHEIPPLDDAKDLDVNASLNMLTIKHKDTPQADQEETPVLQDPTDSVSTSPEPSPPSTSTEPSLTSTSHPLPSRIDSPEKLADVRSLPSEKEPVPVPPSTSTRPSPPSLPSLLGSPEEFPDVEPSPSEEKVPVPTPPSTSHSLPSLLDLPKELPDAGALPSEKEPETAPPAPSTSTKSSLSSTSHPLPSLLDSPDKLPDAGSLPSKEKTIPVEKSSETLSNRLPEVYVSEDIDTPVAVATPVSEFSPEQIEEWENAFYTKLEEFFEIPKCSFIDSLGTVSARQPYATQVSSRFEVEEGEEGEEDVAMIAEVKPLSQEEDDVIQGLVSLFQNYEHSIPTLLSQPIIEPAPVVDSIENPDGLRAQYAMSKHQIQLTMEEGHLWEALANDKAQASFDAEDAEEKLGGLAQRSENLTKSYENRNNLPTTQTYEESKTILRALGVPCIEAAEPFEAEAVAASLVRHGLADFVASEDTDVLIYEAPLLRNITSRNSPLMLYSATEIREALQLDQPSYIDFAVLLGTDFSQRIKNLGPHRAIKLIQQHGKIETLLEKEKKFVPRIPQEAYLDQVQIARQVFSTLPPVPSESLEQKESDEAHVIALLDRFGVYRAAMVDWDHSTALEGNYFNDNPFQSSVS
ncbi:hypothetical protein M422DRAFT_35967 [Sphaerobolus stellatus SS14]|uniref:PIN domain-like protein n=1 Tax=Sphaerobolus stellatus (strain SS14) TaxID=990650 RepID=A0A0C9TPX3_SPHS4|nr:hypothetical protein M422DRAFT_35967 [Sphaerobolus stellatus SS14]